MSYACFLNTLIGSFISSLISLCVIDRWGIVSKASPLPAKLSQKQRKLMAMASKEGTQDRTAVIQSPTAPVVNPSKPAKAW